MIEALGALFPHVSEEAWQSRCERGLITDGDGIPFDAASIYRAGLLVRYQREVADEISIPGIEHILFRNDRFVIVDKPHFLPVSPTGGWVRETLLSRLIATLGKTTLSPAHRLDRGTAGLMLFTTEPRFRDAYQALFRERRIEKEYEALAAPLPQLGSAHLHRSRLVPGEPFFRMIEATGPANSETRIEVIDRGKRLWRYRLTPLTGRKHQLRVHMAALGAPLLNDPWYPELSISATDDPERPLGLIARRLCFDDPVTGERHSFTSDRPFITPLS